MRLKIAVHVRIGTQGKIEPVKNEIMPRKIILARICAWDKDWNLKEHVREIQRDHN
jgi:hypothetical protein